MNKINFKMKKRTILLDLGGVVFQSKGISNRKIDWDVIWKMNEIYGPMMDLGEKALPEFLREYNNQTDQSLEAEEFLKEIFDTLTFNKSLIEALKAYGDIIIVSDNYPENIEYISRRYNFSDWATKQFYSYDYKMYKANPLFFKRLLKDIEEYNVEDLIFIDDSISKLESAAKNNIYGIRYRDNAQTLKEINKYINTNK